LQASVQPVRRRAEETPEEPESANPTFGQSYEWSDGLSVTVGKPTEFRPSDSAAAEEADAYVSFSIKIVNGTDESYDPVLSTVTVQSGNTEAAEVVDTANGFEGPPSTPILPGREGMWKVGFGVSDPDDLVMQVTPGFEYESVIFVVARGRCRGLSPRPETSRGAIRPSSPPPRRCSNISLVVRLCDVAAPDQLAVVGTAAP
jgi:hypothetical protein